MRLPSIHIYVHQFHQSSSLHTIVYQRLSKKLTAASPTQYANYLIVLNSLHHFIFFFYNSTEITYSNKAAPDPSRETALFYSFISQCPYRFPPTRSIRPVSLRAPIYLTSVLLAIPTSSDN